MRIRPGRTISVKVLQKKQRWSNYFPRVCHTKGIESPAVPTSRQFCNMYCTPWLSPLWQGREGHSPLGSLYSGTFLSCTEALWIQVAKGHLHCRTWFRPSIVMLRMELISVYLRNSLSLKIGVLWHLGMEWIISLPLSKFYNNLLGLMKSITWDHSLVIIESKTYYLRNNNSCSGF